MDTLDPPPSTALLSAEEAKERLRDIVEGFFFRRLRTEGGKRVGRLLALETPHLRQIEPAPQVTSPESGRSPGEFHTAV